MCALHILDLKNDCLGYLLNYLTTEDRISFARVCHRFREVFIAWSTKNYRQFTLDLKKSKQELIGFCICRESVQSLTIDLCYFDTFQERYTENVTPLTCFENLCFALTGMVSLNCLVIKQAVGTLIERVFERIFIAVKDLNELKILRLHAINDFTYVNLSQLSHLEELHLLVSQISAPVLAKCCKSNPNIRFLHIGYNSVLHSLSDIVPHCANLETLKLGIIAEASVFTPLAKLPKLRRLIYYGTRPYGSFVPLLTKLAARSQIQDLIIDGGTLSPEETQQIVRLHRLQRLKCFCPTAESVEKLAQLTQLQKLSIWMSSRSDISAALLKIIGECKQLQLLRIACGNLRPDFVDDVLKLLNEIKTGTPKQSLKLEIPFSDHAKPIELCLKNNLINYSAFELASWKDI